MGENKRVIEIKKQKLRVELSKPRHFQNEGIIFRLQDSIKRHKNIQKGIKYHRKKEWKKRKK